jgi:hypothetical protein
MPMKMPTAAQRKAAQAVVDHEEAVEAERERRRAERASREDLAERQRRTKKIANVKSALVGVFSAVRYLAKEAWPTVGAFIVMFALVAFLGAVTLPSADADIGYRLGLFLKLFIQFVALFAPLVTGFPIILAWFAGAAVAGIVISLVFRFVVLPIARLAIRKMRT